MRVHPRSPLLAQIAPAVRAVQQWADDSLEPQWDSADFPPCRPLVEWGATQLRRFVWAHRALAQAAVQLHEHRMGIDIVGGGRDEASRVLRRPLPILLPWPTAGGPDDAQRAEWERAGRAPRLTEPAYEWDMWGWRVGAVDDEPAPFYPAEDPVRPGRTRRHSADAPLAGAR